MADADTMLADALVDRHIEQMTRLLMQDEPTRRPIRREMIEGLIRYKEQHIEPGSFLRAVLENDLKGALNKADLYNQHSLPAITAWCWNNMPVPAWGSPERVRAWLKS